MSRLVFILSFVLAAPLAAQGGGTPAEIPPGHMPPPGMCRIWIDGVPAGRQPAPTDCATAIRRRPPNARVIFGPEPRDVNGAKGAARIPLPQFRDDKSKEPTREPLKVRDAEPQPARDADKRGEVQRPREEERGKGKTVEPRPTPPAPHPVPRPRPQRPPGNGFSA